LKENVERAAHDTHDGMTTSIEESVTAEQPVELTLVIPVRNEGANFPGLWREITAHIHSPFRALVVYDFDADDTVPAVRQILASGERRLVLVKNQIGRGVVGAIQTGFNHVLEGAVLVVMADLSDDLTRVDQMLGLYKAGYEVVGGSRYMLGGKLVDAPFAKQAFSRIAGVSLRWLRPYRRTTLPTPSSFMMRPP
jgi:dolichol-phosphate mannosyltransferase